MEKNVNYSIKSDRKTGNNLNVHNAETSSIVVQLQDRIIYTMEYYTAFKSEVEPFVLIWKDL